MFDRRGVDLPEEPSLEDFLKVLLALKQLQKLQIVGYSSVMPVLLLGLVGSLPKLQGLDIGLCGHSAMESLREDDDQEDWVQPPADHGSWRQAVAMCERMVPGLKVRVAEGVPAEFRVLPQP
jgi:hypothetical protein